jgi:hypothetical protein
MLRLPFADVRSVARRHQARVTDVLLCLVAGALRRVGAVPGTTLRAAVPLMIREPDSSAEANVTAAVMVDVPLDDVAEVRRLDLIARSSDRLRRPTRPLASRFVMQAVGTVLPVRAHAWFARTVYGQRFFHAIVSNMPGPPVQLHLGTAPIEAAFPLLPLAPGAPLAIGAMGWNADLCFGISSTPELFARLPAGDAAFVAALREVFTELASAVPVSGPCAPSRRARARPARAPRPAAPTRARG